MADIKVRVGQQNATKVISSLGSGTLSLTELSDVNASSLSNGMVLVYNEKTKIWRNIGVDSSAAQNLDINGEILNETSIIRIKRSSGTAKPASLNWGEMAYVTGIGSYGGVNQYKDRVFLGDDGLTSILLRDTIIHQWWSIHLILDRCIKYKK